MTTKQIQPAAAGRNTYPVLMPLTTYEAARTRAAELYIVPTQYFQGCIKQLIALGGQAEIVAAAVEHRRAPHGQAVEKKSWNFELPQQLREEGQAAARALGLTLSSFLISCAELLAKAPDPEYLKAPVVMLKARVKEVRRAESRAGKKKAGSKAGAAQAEDQ